MQTFKIFVLGIVGSRTTTFVQSARELQEGLREHNYSHPYNFGRILIEDAAVLYFYAWSKDFSMQGLIETLSPSESAELGQIFEKFARTDLSDTGLIVVIDSADPTLDKANEVLLQNIRSLMQYKLCPYVVALSQLESDARTPRQMRAALHIPDEIIVIGCTVKDPASTREVVLALLALMPQDTAMRRLMDGIKAKL